MLDKVNLVMTLKENEKFYAVADTFDGNQNLINKLSNKRIVTVNVCGSKKEAEKIAAEWNKTFEQNGTFLYSKQSEAKEKVVKGDTSSFENYVPSDNILKALRIAEQVTKENITAFRVAVMMVEAEEHTPDWSLKEKMFLAERWLDTCYASDVAIHSGERTWALSELLEEGISKDLINYRNVELPEISADKIKEVLINCDIDDFTDLIDYVATQNSKYFLDDPTVEYFYDPKVMKRLSEAVTRSYAPESLDEVIKTAEQSKDNILEKNSVKAHRFTDHNR